MLYAKKSLEKEAYMYISRNQKIDTIYYKLKNTYSYHLSLSQEKNILD